MPKSKPQENTPPPSAENCADSCKPPPSHPPDTHQPPNPREEGLGYSKVGMTKGKLVLEHSLGLGQQPNVVPWDFAEIDGAHRIVRIGWHPVGGFGGKWFAEKTGLGKYITETVRHYPDPTQHWAVLVGEFAHQLWMDEHFNVIYINENVVSQDWHTFAVGKTRFNDEALRQAGLLFPPSLPIPPHLTTPTNFSIASTGEMVIHNMRNTRPAYNIITNNCQNFAVSMLDAIQIGSHREFATTFAVYQAATGKGTIKDLFVDKHPEEQVDHAAGVVTEGKSGSGGGSAQGPSLRRQDTVSQAQQVMDHETTRLDDHSKLFE